MPDDELYIPLEPSKTGRTAAIMAEALARLARRSTADADVPLDGPLSA